MNTDHTANHRHHRDNVDVHSLEARPVAARPEALLELACTLQKLKRLCAELSHALPQDAVETLLKETFPDLATLAAQEPSEDGGTVHGPEYREAERQLNQEKEQYLGLADVIKHLLLWEESPEERLQKNTQKNEGD